MAQQDGTNSRTHTTFRSGAALAAVLQAHPAAHHALLEKMAAFPEYGVWLSQLSSDVPDVLARRSVASPVS